MQGFVKQAQSRGLDAAGAVKLGQAVLKLPGLKPHEKQLSRLGDIIRKSPGVLKGLNLSKVSPQLASWMSRARLSGAMGSNS
jgi:hypothetical protein